MGDIGSERRSVGVLDCAERREQAGERGLPWSGVDGGAEQVYGISRLGRDRGSRHQIYVSDHYEEERAEE